ncbi:MAG: hypothetical protein QOI95_3230 [Acidimicrobiaceae bacterium]
MNVIVEVLGWSGAVLVIGAYLLSTRDIWPASGTKSAVVNVVGAALLTTNAWYHRAFPSAALNVVWIAIGAATLARAAGRNASPGEST